MATEFDDLVADVRDGVASGFDALFRQAAQRLAKDHPDGVDVREIGALAWSQLPIAEYPATFQSLFYCYWLVQHQEQQAARIHEDALTGATFEVEALGRARDALDDAPDDEGCVPVDVEALRSLADEVEVLRVRVELLEGGAL
jgi:hypothetical protein